MRTRPVVLVLMIAVVSVIVPPGIAEATASCWGMVPNRIGTTGDDLLVGTVGNDVFYGDAGHDTIVGLDGNDVVCPGPGFDHIIGGLGDDLVVYLGQPMAANSGVTVVLNAGAVVLTGTWPGTEVDLYTGVDSVVGTNAPDVMTGSPLANRLFGLGGDDVLEGLHGDDLIDGGAGDDTLAANMLLSDTDPDSEGSSIDPAIEDDDWLKGGDGNDVLTANLDNVSMNRLYGDAGTDTLNAESGNDVLNGGAGVDLVSYHASFANLTIDLTTLGEQNTGEGRDWFAGVEDLHGGSGDDTFLGTSGANDLVGDGGFDVVNGRGGGDHCVAEVTINCT